jgi:hypothetical protein
MLVTAREGLLKRINDKSARIGIIVDGRQFFNPETVTRLGFIYRGVGAKNR